MILLDVNVVVAAFRSSHPHHDAVRPWFDALLAAPEPFTVPDVVWSSFVRIVTNRRIFAVPSPAADAFDFVRAVRDQPRHVSIAPGDRHLEVFEQLCVDGQAVGDLVPDAYIASLALEQGASVATLDRDFARFTGLSVVAPPT